MPIDHISLFDSLLHMSGTGAACYLLYLLHKSSVQPFREELALERAATAEARAMDREGFAARSRTMTVQVINALATTINGACRYTRPNKTTQVVPEATIVLDVPQP